MLDSLVEQLIALRHKKKISQHELSELSDVPDTTIARMESGRIRPNMSTIDKLLEALRGEATIIEKAPGFQCHISVRDDGIVKIPSPILKRLGIRKNKEGQIQLRVRGEKFSLEHKKAMIKEEELPWQS